MSTEHFSHTNLEKDKTKETTDVWIYTPAESTEATANKEDHEAALAYALDTLDDPEKKPPVPNQTIWITSYDHHFAQLQAENPTFRNTRKAAYTAVTSLIPDTGLLSYLAA